MTDVDNTAFLLNTPAEAKSLLYGSFHENRNKTVHF